MNFTLNMSETIVNSFETITKDKINSIAERISKLQEEKIGFEKLLEEIHTQRATINIIKESTYSKVESSTISQQPLFATENRDVKDAKYPYGDSYPKQARYILGVYGKPMSTTEIVDTIIKNNPELKNERAKVVVSISAALGDDVNKTKKYFYKITGKTKGRSKYGLLIWKEGK